MTSAEVGQCHRFAVDPVDKCEKSSGGSSQVGFPHLVGVLSGTSTSLPNHSNFNWTLIDRPATPQVLEPACGSDELWRKS
jgi:hypothetical protein